ncbi:MAG: hypothetical protein Q4C70_13910 [Planctomycetia bacterium]|nr:hypothetical protein [Planctomycetia bacterium]
MTLVTVLTVFTCLSLVQLSASGQDFSRPNVSGNIYEENVNFRVNYKVMMAESSELISSGKTIFCDGNAYDFVDNSDEIIIFNPEAKKIYVLDVKSRKKWETTPDEVEEYATKICRWGMSNEKEEIRQFFQPDFKVEYDNKKREYSFVSENYSYFVTPVKPDRTEFLEQYRVFARSSCRTNMALSPGSRTLYARFLVNETVFNAGYFIERLQLSLRAQSYFGKSTVLLSEYQYLPRLVESDMATIRQVQDYLAIFERGTLAEFQEKRLQTEAK